MMMRRTVVSGIAMMLAAASLTLSAYAQSSTAFTYQGFLKDNNNPANAKYDLQFTLYDAPTGGNRIGNPFVIEDLQITNGLFTVEIDFGINPFSSGQRRWIEIGIRPFDSTRPFVTLDPRIELTPVPYAIYAQKAKDAENAQNAQNAETADVANSVVSGSVTSAGLANDPDSLSKVSGGNLSITDGFLKKGKHVYFRANDLVVYGQPYSYSGFTYDNLAPSFPRNGWYALRFRDSDITSTNVTVNHSDAGFADQDDVGTRVTVPVSGYYFIQCDANIYHVLGSGGWHNGSIGIQVKPSGSGNWSILESGASAINGAFNYSDVHISTIAYLPAGTTIRAVAYGEPWVRLGRSGSRRPSLVIYLLSAADAPSN
jgi:hypothetical protein